MESIKSLFAKPIDRKIEEVIKVDQANEQTVLNELEEYIVTESIRDHYELVYDEIIDTAKSPREGIGVWVSGFFGSGKSSFAKILGYTAAAIPVCGRSASGIFKENVKDAKISDRLEIINRTIPMDAVIFDVSMDRGVRTASERITEIMYKALLRTLDYSEDFDLADLEITLEGDGRLESFCERFEKLHDKTWSVRRKVGLGINEASAVLHDMDPKTYPEADSYAKSIGIGRADIDPNRLAQRAFELAGRRKPGKALIFIIDEVGQYVSRSVDKMLDLQAVVQAFGKEGKNRVERKQAVAPFWIVVTSQEKLNEIVDALDDKKIELARLQDRFRITIDLKQTDIPEITGKRVLDKTGEAKTLLEKHYEDNEGRLKSLCTLERTSKDVAIDTEQFVNLYPYLPYQIDLCIDIVAGLRLRRGAHRHIGGSNRTIIKQAQEMLINPRTRLADAPVGTLVTLDKVYELLYLGNLLPSETTREVDEVPKVLPDNEMALKVVKAVALLETVKDLPRTVHNIAVVLHPSVEADSIEKEVERALKDLEKAQVVKDSEEGFKLLTVQEKKWDITRRGLAPKPADRNRITRELLREIFADPKIRNYRYNNLRPFRIALAVEGESVDAEGQVPVNLLIAEDPADRNTRQTEARESSGFKQEEAFWVTTFTDEIHDLVQEFFRSREMISTFERVAASGKLTPEEAACLADEKVDRDKTQRKLRSKIIEALESGTGYFRSIERDASALGKGIAEIFHKFLDQIIPDLYPKLEMGIRQLQGNEAERLLTAANLNGLPPVFYDGENGLFLVTKQSGKFIVNLSAEICREMLTYLIREHKYGNKVTGKMLESYFQGIGYGWDRDVIQLVMAVLLRGGAVELTYQGRKYRSHSDPGARVPFTKVPAFRTASFAPREPIDLKTLADAARQYEEITGKEVDIEEGAIAEAFKKTAMEDRERLLPVVAVMKAERLPGLQTMQEFLDTVSGVLEMPADDCVKTLAGEGKSYNAARSQSSKLEQVLNDENLELIRKARHISQAQWELLKELETDEAVHQKAAELLNLLESDAFFESIEAIRQDADYVADRYTDRYAEIHATRKKLYSEALEQIKNSTDWKIICQYPDLGDAERETVLKPLTDRAEHDLDFTEDGLICKHCRAGIGQLETDINLADAVREQTAKSIGALIKPPAEETVARIRISSMLTGTLETEEDVEIAINELRNQLLKIILSGKKVILE